MRQISYYEQGLAPCDAFFVLSRIERRREWAIVLDHSHVASYLNRSRPNWQVFVNGVLVNTCANHSEATAVMQDYVDGFCWIPGWPTRVLRSSRSRGARRP
jgi:hypothetical protein